MTKTKKTISKPTKKPVKKSAKTLATKKGKKPVKKTIKKVKAAVKKVVSKVSRKKPEETKPLPTFKIQTIADLGLDLLDAEYQEAYLQHIAQNEAKETDVKKLHKNAYDACHPSYAEKLNQALKDKLGVSVVEMKEVLSKKTIEKAEDLTVEMKNIAPYADYSKLIETNDQMAEFMRTEGHKWENWRVQSISQDPNLLALLRVRFQNSSVDEGETIFGTVFVSKNGIIRHSMVVASE